MEQTGIETLEWPSGSPDPNNNDNIFRMFPEKVRDGPQPKTKVQLEQLIDDAVKLINIKDSEKLKNFYNSISKKIRTVLSKIGQKFIY